MSKPARRTDGICPRCGIRPKKRSFCVACDNQRQRDRRHGLVPKVQPRPKDSNGLTELQVQIANYICHGLESSQIAARTGYHHDYVRHQKGRMYDITGCVNAAHLAAWAVLNGYYKQLDERERLSARKTLLQSFQHGATA